MRTIKTDLKIGYVKRIAEGLMKIASVLDEPLFSIEPSPVMRAELIADYVAGMIEHFAKKFGKPLETYLIVSGRDSVYVAVWGETSKKIMDIIAGRIGKEIRFPEIPEKYKGVRLVPFGPRPKEVRFR